MTGCGAEVDPELLAATPGVDGVVPNHAKGEVVRAVRERAGDAPGWVWSEAGYDEMLSRHPMDREWPTDPQAPPLPKLVGRTRTFLKVQDGCNAFCTYCVIPYGRGPARSQTIDQVVGQVQGLVSRGVREVVLTGINLGEFGIERGQGPELEQLVQAILGQTEVERLRLGSLDPTEITPGLFQLMEQDPRLCPHLHVSVQALDDRVLKRMRRKYGVGEVLACLDRVVGLRTELKPWVEMDLITGFPGESHDRFESAARLLSGAPWDRLHVFPYSERSGTPATRLDESVERGERLHRGRVLRQMSLERVGARYRAECAPGQVHEIVAENPSPAHARTLTGLTPNYLKVELTLGEEQPLGQWWNQILRVRPVGVEVDPVSGDAVIQGERVAPPSTNQRVT
jgi:threonylcarbamoyladenosine tRNA methylthiotransferase MtaB